MYSCDGLGGVQCWDLRCGVEPALTWDLSPTAIHCVAVDPAGRLLACAGGDGHVTLLDTSHQQVRMACGCIAVVGVIGIVLLQEWCLRGHEECVWSVAISPTADTLLSSAADGSVMVWR